MNANCFSLLALLVSFLIYASLSFYLNHFIYVFNLTDLVSYYYLTLSSFKLLTNPIDYFLMAASCFFNLSLISYFYFKVASNFLILHKKWITVPRSYLPRQWFLIF